jgi:predicted nucleotidyltransferase
LPAWPAPVGGIAATTPLARSRLLYQILVHIAHAEGIVPRDLHALLPQSTIRVVTHFLVHPGSARHFRALQRHTGLSIHSLQRELSRLEALGLIHRREEAGRVLFSARADHPSWAAFRVLLREHAPVADVVRDALFDVDGVEIAFVFGSQVRSDARPDSDVDLFVVGDDISGHRLGDALLRAQALLDRPIDVKRYTRRKLERSLVQGGRFLRNVLDGPKEWLVGSDEALPIPPNAS